MEPDATRSRVSQLLQAIVTAYHPDAYDAGLRELQSLDSSAVIDVLSRATSDANFLTRSRAAQWLIDLRPADARNWIGRLLEDPDSRVRRALTRKIAEVIPKQATPFLVARLGDDPEDDVRWEAAKRLQRIGDLSALPILRRAYREDQGVDFEGRLVADESAEAVMKIFKRNFPVDRDYTDAEVEDLIVGLQSLDMDIESDALERLKSVDSDRLNVALRALATDDNPRLKTAAAEAMKHFGRIT